MKKIKLFLSSIDAEENWINAIQKQGWCLSKVSSWLPLYHFEESKDQPPASRPSGLQRLYEPR